MKIQGSASSYIPPQTNLTKRTDTTEAFKSVLTQVEATAVNGETSKTKPADLANVRPMEMRAWLNEQIRTGKMTLDESTPFMGMTISAESDSSPVNYLQKIKAGIEAAIWRGDSEGRARWERAWDLAERYQYQNVGVSTYA